MNGTPKIEALKGLENYFSWQIQVQDIFTEADLIGYLKDTTTAPTEAAAFETWRTKDRKALGMIRLQCSSAVVVHITDSATSKAAWDTLQNTYANASVMSKIMLLKRLQKANIAEGVNMEPAIWQLLQLHQQHNKMGGLMSDEEFAQIILATLLSSWDPLINSIQSTTSSADVMDKGLTLRESF